MRRRDREVTGFDALLAIVQDCDVCRLAISNGEVPYLVPLNFGEEVVDGTLYLYFHSAQAGTKYALLQAHPQVAFEMDCGHTLILDESDMNCTMAYRSVMGIGTIEICSEEEKLHGLDCIMRHYHAEGFAYSHAAVPRTAVLRLRVETMTGKQRKNKTR